MTAMVSRLTDPASWVSSTAMASGGGVDNRGLPASIASSRATYNNQWPDDRVSSELGTMMVIFRVRVIDLRISRISTTHVQAKIHDVVC